MIRTFVFNEFNNNWIEENVSILYHDLCAIFDEDNNSIYIWNGPKSSKKKLKMGMSTLKGLIAKYPDKNYSIENYSKETPKQICVVMEKHLEALKKGEIRRDNNFTRFTTIRLFIIFQLMILILVVISIMNIFTSLAWATITNNFVVYSDIYREWLTFSVSLTIFSLVFIIFNLIIGIIESESQVIILSSLGLIISIGLIVYLQQGVFLFIFQEGSTQSVYYIAQSDLILFLFFIGASSTIFELPNLIKLGSILKTYRKFIF